MLPVPVRYVGPQGCRAREKPRVELQAQPQEPRSVGVALSLRLIPKPHLQTHVMRILCQIAEKQKSLLCVDTAPLGRELAQGGLGSACPCTCTGMHTTLSGAGKRPVRAVGFPGSRQGWTPVPILW